jgi:hypothetical protein
LGGPSSGEYTANRIKELAKKGVTVDQLINELLSPKKGNGWVVCELCGAKVKIENLHNHRERVRPTV